MLGLCTESAGQGVWITGSGRLESSERRLTLGSEGSHMEKSDKDRFKAGIEAIYGKRIADDFAIRHFDATVVW